MPRNRTLAVFGVAAFPLTLLLPVAPQDPDRQLATERYDAVRAVLAIDDTARQIGLTVPESAATVEARVTWSRRLAEAAVGAGAMKPGEAFAQHLARVEKVLAETKVLFDAGRQSAMDVAVLRFHVAEAKDLAARNK